MLSHKLSNILYLYFQSLGQLDLNEMNGNVDTHWRMSNMQEIYTINMINTINSPGG